MKPEQLVKSIIQIIDKDFEREGLKDTPARVVKSWSELYRGYREDPKDILSTCFEAAKYDQMVILRDIEFYSTCEHHMLPFFGKAHVAYIPTKKVVGLSKLARLVDCFSRRLQIQERLTDQIANSIQQHLSPQGVGVIIEAKHFCMVARGVGKQNSVMETTALRGVMLKEPETRAEFIAAVRRK